jgi:hypothetical protein
VARQSDAGPVARPARAVSSALDVRDRRA